MTLSDLELFLSKKSTRGSQTLVLQKRERNVFFPLSIKVSQIIKREGKGGVLGQEKGQPFMGKAITIAITINCPKSLFLARVLT